MIKSVIKIEQDIRQIVKDSVLGHSIGGEVYLLENRPHDSTAEDITIAHLTGDTKQTQSGVVMLNIFVAGIPYDGRIVSNRKRIDKLITCVYQMLWDYGGEYTLSTTNINPEPMQDEDTKQFYINVRLQYSRMCS